MEGMNKTLQPLEILALHLEGQATDTQLKQLITALRDDESLRREAIRITAVHGQLSIVLEDEVSRERHVMQTLTSVRQADSEHFKNAVIHKLKKRRKLTTTAIGVAAAVVMLGVFSFYFSNHQSVIPTLQQAATVATIKRADGVQWPNSNRNNGSSLVAGQSIKIQSGLLELDLAGRGRMIIEGPAEINFPSPGLAVLHQGRIVMRATKKGHGYKIQTAQGSIVDLGTEFGISVEPDGSVQTHVIDGSIEVIPNHGESTTLSRNNALEINMRGRKVIPADSGKFYTLLPPMETDMAKYIYWGMNEGENNMAKASGKLARGNSDMIFHAIEQGVSPTWEAGVKGTALHFDGKGGYTQSNYLGIGGKHARTVCFWVKVPEDFDLHQGFAMLSWGNERQLGSVWQISANPRSQDGPLGRLRIGLHGAQVIGTTDLRDSQWHHVAVVLYGGSKPNIGTHVILYIDGKMETLSRRSLAEVKTNIKDAHHGVWLGRNITYTHPSSNHRDGGFFRGDLDEVYIFNAALSQKEILKLIESVLTHGE